MFVLMMHHGDRFAARTCRLAHLESHGVTRLKFFHRVARECRHLLVLPLSFASQPVAFRAQAIAFGVAPRHP